MTHGSKLFQRERLPTVSEIVEVIWTMPYEVERCVYIKRGAPAQPLDEVYIEIMGVWCDFDGRRYSADRGRGFAYPGFFDRLRIAWAIRRWRNRMGIAYNRVPRRNLWGGNR